MVAEFETIQERVISGKGVLKVPADKDKNRSYLLYASVVRPPKNLYVNKNYNPTKSRYGTLVFLRKGYVVNDASIEYSEQVYDGVNDVSGQTLIALKCVNNAILQSILNLSVALAATPGGQGLAPINFVNVIKDYTNLRLAWDECRLVCYADTAISLRLMRLKYDTCNEEYDDDSPPPPPPPPKQPPVPPGTPVTVSDPYTGSNDNNNTEPYPEDLPESQAPTGNLCQPVTVVAYLTSSYAPNSREHSATVFGKVYGIRAKITPGSPGNIQEFQIDCHGTSSCGVRNWYTVVTLGGLTEVTLISMTPL